MTIRRARAWLVTASLIAVGFLATFLFVAPPLGYPLRFDQAFRLLESVAPTFAAILGSATIFVIRGGGEKEITVPPARASLLGILTKGPVILFVAIAVAAFGGFSFSNSATAYPGTGMTVDDLAHALAFGNVMLGLTTTAIGAWLFEQEKGADESHPGSLGI